MTHLLATRPLQVAVVLIASLGATPVRSHAQALTSVAVDATAGSGYGRGGEYRDRATVGARLATSVRRWQTSRVAVFGEISMDWLAITMGHDAICVIGRRTECVAPYPELSGPAAIVGLVAARTDRRLEARLGLGGGAYVADRTRVGAGVSQLDAAVFPVRHLGLVVGSRWTVLPRYRSDKLSMLTWSFGARVR